MDIVLILLGQYIKYLRMSSRFGFCRNYNTDYNVFKGK